MKQFLRALFLFALLAALCAAVPGADSAIPHGGPAPEQTSCADASPATPMPETDRGPGTAAVDLTADPDPDARGWQLTQTLARGGDGSYTLTLQLWYAGTPPDGPVCPAALRYDLAEEWRLDADALTEVFALARTSTGWAQTKQARPELKILTDTVTGTLCVTGFDDRDYVVTEKPCLDDRGRAGYGCKLVVRVTGVQPDYAATMGGQGIAAGQGGVYADVSGDDLAPWARFAPTAADIPLRCDWAPASQTLIEGQGVNFGYMINPPAGGTGTLPDGGNNAWCQVRYTISRGGRTLAEFTVPPATPMLGGSWTILPPDPAPAEAGDYIVTVTLASVYGAADPGTATPLTERVVLQSTARVEG